VTATGSGWSPGHVVSVQWDDGTELAATMVDDTGGFTVSFTVPANATEREYTINFVGIYRHGGEESSCPNPTVTFSAPSGTVGDTIRVQGKGWRPGGTVDLIATEPL
jgi:hypothetical protein